MKTLASLLPLRSMTDDAFEEAKNVCSRWDVPSGPDVPEDLRDTAGRLLAMPDGSPVAARMVPTDLTTGSASAAVPLLIAMLPVLAVLGGSFPKTVPLLVLVGLIVCYCLDKALGAERNRWVFAFGLGLPIFGPLLSGGLSAVSLPGVMSAMGAATLAVPVAIVCAITWLFSSDGNSKENIKKAGQGLAAFALVSIVAQWVLPRSMVSAPWYAIACLTPWVYVASLRKKRAEVLLEQASVATASSTGKLATAHIPARREQAQRAAKDSSHFIRLGTARGIFTKKLDGFASDEGLPFGLTSSDLSTHLVCYGETGTGKTSAVMRPVFANWVAGKSGGVLVLDGKGSLAEDLLARRSDALLIKPGVKLGLIEGLSPSDVVMALSQQTTQDAGEGSSASAFFVTQAREQLRHGAVFLEALIEVESASSDTRTWFWTLADLVRLLQLMNGEEGERNLAIEFVGSGHQEATADGLLTDDEEATADGLLTDALSYFKSALPDLADETRSSIWSTVQSWLTPIMGHPDLVRWAKTETGEDVTIAVRGGIVGVCLPSFRYGVAGGMVQSLIKQRLFVSIRRRAVRDWKAEGETPVLFLIDEAQEIVSQADQAMLPVARSLGAVCCYATQDYENFVVKFGPHGAAAVDGNFRSVITLKASEATFQHVQKRFGIVEQLKWNKPGIGLNFIQTAKAQLASPLFDRNHPDASYFRSLRLKGVGGFRPVSRSSNWKQVAFHGVSEVDPRSVGRSNLVFDAAVDPITSSGWKAEPLLAAEDWQTYLSEPFVAVAMVMRGGVVRRDFIRTQPIFDVPEEVARTDG